MINNQHLKLPNLVCSIKGYRSVPDACYNSKLKPGQKTLQLKEYRRRKVNVTKVISLQDLEVKQLLPLILHLKILV